MNLAMSLYHFHDWLFLGYKARLEREFDRQFAWGAASFWEDVARKDSRFASIRDVVDGSRRLNIRAPKDDEAFVTHLANTEIAGPDSQVSVQGESFDECAIALYDFWQALLTKLTRTDAFS